MSKSIYFAKLHTFFLLFLFCLLIIIGSLAVGFTVDKLPVFKMFDAFFYTRIAGAQRIPLIDALIYPFNTNFFPHFLGIPIPSFFYFVVGLPLLYMLIRNRKQFFWMALAIFLGTIIIGMINTTTWHFFFRERPFTHLQVPVEESIKKELSSWPSFPSGHVRETALYGTIIASYIPQLKWVMILLTAFIGFDRLYIGAHYPTDVIAGAIIGYLVAKVTLMLVKEIHIISSRFSQKKTK